MHSNQLSNTGRGLKQQIGIYLNLIGIILITAAIYLLGIHVFGIDLSVMPAWVQ